MTLPHPAGTPGQHGSALPTPRWQQRIDERKRAKLQAAAGHAAAPPQRRTVGDYLGLCLPVAFPDEPATITQAEIEAFCNQPGYAGFGNNGSVFDYYLDNSQGRLRYKTVVAPYHVALQPKQHYCDAARPFGAGAQELLAEALAAHVANGFDFGPLSAESGAVRASNLLYAGAVPNPWGQGLWPHASTLNPGAAIGTQLVVKDYQVTAMGDALSLGVYAHENGHMLCDFPDLYQFGDVRAGCGSYCLMSFGAVADERNPPQIGAYLKYKAGWGTVKMIESGQPCTAAAGTNQFFMLQRNATEYFLIENRKQAGRDAALPDSGLAVWHIDELGSNTTPQAAPDGHRNYECALVQADGRNDLVGHDDGDDSDLFGPTEEPVFPAGGSPTSRWWDGKPSKLQITRIRSAGDGLEFIAELG